MATAIPKLVKDYIYKLLERDQHVQPPHDAQAEFHLVYSKLTLGVLTVKEGVWRFQYTDEFRRHSHLRPIVEFPDVNKVYESEELWPFFSMRIPSLKQPAIEQILKRDGVDRHDEVQLLRKFGKRAATDPFELVAA